MQRGRGGEDKEYGKTARQEQHGQLGDALMMQWYKRWKKLTVHKNLEINYFQKIDKKEKAYWLGFLYADRFLLGTRENDEVQIGIMLGRKDEDTIDRFCECLKLDKGRKIRQIRDGSERVGIVFACKKMSDDLMKHGLTFRKAKRTMLPKLSGRLDLAFLLGYYDGDGTQNRTIITTSNREFLEQIKQRFSLPYKVREKTGEGEIYGKRIKSGTRYLISLGPELFNDMMQYYTESMPRKRKMFCDLKERVRRSIDACKRKDQESKELLRKWRAITKDELGKLVREMSLTQIAHTYHLAGASKISRKCKKLSIPMRPKGYWQKLCWERKRNSK
jgi:hypothetical protein